MGPGPERAGRRRTQFAAIAVSLAQANQEPADWTYPTLEMMIENFASGVRRLVRD